MNLQRVALFIVSILFFTSCISVKRQTYLQEQMEEMEQVNDSISKISISHQPYRVQIDDMLSIRVKALDQDLVNAFNPISQNNLEATTEQKVYFDGFTVNRKGEIKIPVLGEVKVLGLTLKEIEQEIENQLLDQYFKETSNKGTKGCHNPLLN